MLEMKQVLRDWVIDKCIPTIMQMDVITSS